MSVVEVALIALALVVALATLADRLGVPYPILLLLGGIGLGFVPALPRVSIDPGILFLLFIPPLVFATGWHTSWRDFRLNLWPICLLSIGLVLATILVVAVVAHLVIAGLSWPAAFVLGAIVSATDPVAATAIAGHLHLPGRIVTVLEGEGAGNDAASLVAYRAAVTATVTGAFALAPAVLHGILATVGGIAIGLAVAFLADWIQRHLHNPPVEAALTLVIPFAAYIPADQLGLSGVLAVLAAGMLLGHREPETRASDSRLEVDAFWTSLVFVLNGLIFVLLGLYLPGILAQVAGRPIAGLVRDAAVIIAVVVLARIVWVFAMPYVPAEWGRRLRAPALDRAWKRSAVVAWSGMRGADTLVIALALPLTVIGGAPFPDRALVIFVTFTVIVATLIGQGLSLAPLIRWLGLHDDDTVEREVARARLVADQAAVARLDEALARHGAADGTPIQTGATGGGRTSNAAHDGVTRALAERLRRRYARMAKRDAAQTLGRPDPEIENVEAAAQRLRRDLVDAQRQAIIELRERGEIGDTALREVLRDLDLEEQELT